MSKNKNFKSEQFRRNFVEKAQSSTNEIFEEFSESNSQDYEEFMSVFLQSYYANKAKRKLQFGESSMTATFANMLDWQIAKKSAELICQKNEYATRLYEAYKQSKSVKRFLSSEDIFSQAQEFSTELKKIVDKIVDGDEKFEDIVALGLNFVQSSCIYGIDLELARKNIKPKRLTDFENELVATSLKNVVETMDLMLELGQSEYVALFDGRSVCTGMARLSARFMEECFKKLGIDACANVVATDEHAFVAVSFKDFLYVVDPTQYVGSFKQVKNIDLKNAEAVKGAKILKLKKYDSVAHFKVVNYYLEKLKLVDAFKGVDILEPVPVKLARVLGHIEGNFSQMSGLVSPKAVFVNDREFSVEFYFELCLNALNISYETGLATTDFYVKDLTKTYYVDLDKAFNAQNKLKSGNKFMAVIGSKPSENCDESANEKM